MNILTCSPLYKPETFQAQKNQHFVVLHTAARHLGPQCILVSGDRGVKTHVIHPPSPRDAHSNVKGRCRSLPRPCGLSLLEILNVEPPDNGRTSGVRWDL